MKKILQAIDSASTKPVEGTSDMKRFVSIIQDSNKEQQVLNEGANPHKVSLPVQMAMQHYQQPVVKKPTRPALIDKYFEQVQEEQLQEKKERRQLINQYAQTIAERVMMKEGVVNEKSVSQKQARTMAAAAHDPKFAKKLGISTSVAKEFNKADTGTKRLSNAMKKESAWHTSPSGARTNMSPSDDDYEINYGKHGAAALDEVSKDTLKSYVKKNKEDTVQRASSDSYKSGAAGDKYNKADITDKDTRREKGMDRALNKLAKENFNPQLSDNPMFHPGPGGPGMMPNESEGDKEGVPHLTRELLSHIVQQIDTEGAHAVVKSLEWGDGAAKELLQLIKRDLSKYVNVHESKSIKAKKKSDPCWTGYHQVGMKKKGAKTVPNCVPKGKQINELSNEKLGQYKTAASKSASAADKAGDFETGNKRFKGIVKATNKQFNNDLKKNSGK